MPNGFALTKFLRVFFYIVYIYLFFLEPSLKILLAANIPHGFVF